jgi:hypothetical protein
MSQFTSIKAENKDKIGATSHQELLLIGEDYLNETIDETLEIIKGRGIMEIKKHQLKIIMDIIVSDIIDRSINTQIECKNQFSSRYK